MKKKETTTTLAREMIYFFVISIEVDTFLRLYMVLTFEEKRKEKQKNGINN